MSLRVQARQNYKAVDNRSVETIVKAMTSATDRLSPSVSPSDDLNRARCPLSGGGSRRPPFDYRLLRIVDWHTRCTARQLLGCLVP